LRAERQRVDEVLGVTSSPVDETADAVVEKARARADAVLADERAKADSGPSGSRTTHAARTLGRERAVEDGLVDQERARADDVLRKERAEHAAALALEREDTDNDLSAERSRADHAVGTRDDFLGVVSHDLRNMLHVVVGFAGLIADAESGRAPHRAEDVLRHAQRIQRSGSRMNRLIGDLVDVASIEAGALAVSPQPSDAGHVIAEIVENFQAQAGARGVSLVSDVAGDATSGTFDPARILQVLANLVSNALKFTPAGGSVAVRVARAGEELRFTVTDTGEGIPSDQLDTIFERFHQLRRGEGGGVGLGLYIAKCILQGHGRQISVESRVGEGSTFAFTLPVAETA
jgi:signal transduction histidine kinase